MTNGGKRPCSSYGTVKCRLNDCLYITLNHHNSSRRAFSFNYGKIVIANKHEWNTEEFYSIALMVHLYKYTVLYVHVALILESRCFFLQRMITLTFSLPSLFFFNAIVMRRQKTIGFLEHTIYERKTRDLT